MTNKTLLLLIISALASNVSLAQHSLTMNFSEMDPHIGQRFEVRVTETVTAKEVVKELLQEIPAADFSMDFVALRTGHSYFVDFYADMNDNGKYDAPPVDHVWRLTLDNVTEDQVINFVHDTNFTDVGWPGQAFLSYLETVWGGKWENLTFGSTDSILVEILLVCDSLHLDMETKGLFGDPAVVTFSTSVQLNDNLGSPTDTIKFDIDTPLVGELVMINGKISADFVHPLVDIGIQFSGNIAAGQVMALYTVTTAGAEFANGYFYASSLDVVDARSKVRVRLTSSDTASCSGVTDGAATVMASGGFPPYNYLWSDGSTNPDRDSLAAGSYTVSATDQNGCLDTLIVVIESAVELTINVDQVVDISCFGDMDGFLQVSGAGGTPPYVYLWDDGRSNPSHDLLSAGAHAVTMTDANGCQVDTSINVGEPNAIMLDISVTHESAVDANDGTANATVAGGTPPYTYLWNTGDTLMALTDLSPGQYELFVTDANGCTEQESFTIQAFVCTLSIDSVEVTHITSGKSNGAISVQIGGGTMPFTFSWDKDGKFFSNEQDLTGLTAGDYVLTVEDSKGCIVVSDTLIVQSSTATIEINPVFNVYPNPASTYVRIESDFQWNFRMLDAGGKIIMSQQNKVDGEMISLTGVESGVYFLEISDGQNTWIKKLIVNR